MPEIKSEDIGKVLQEALYIGVGLGVIAFQKAQVQRVELTKQLKAQLGDAREQVEKIGSSSDDLASDARRQVDKLTDSFEGRVKLVEERLEAIESQIEGLLDQIEDKLPEQARALVRSARETAKEARSQVRSLVRGNGVAA